MHNTTRQILDVIEGLAPKAERRHDNTPEGGHLVTFVAPARPGVGHRYLTVREATLGTVLMGWQIQEGFQVPSPDAGGWANDQLATYAFLAEDEAAEALDQAEECARRLVS